MKNVKKQPGGVLIAIVFFSIMLFSCSSPDTSAPGRAKRAEKSRGPIFIGAALGPTYGSSLWQGIELAKEEVNAGGGVLGRKINIIKKNDHDSITEGEKAAQEFIENPDIIAVIGHTLSYVSLSVSPIYEYYGVLMFSPLYTAPSLAQGYLKKVFRNIPDDSVFGRRLASFCKVQGWKRIIIYNSSDKYGKNLADIFETECYKKGLKVPDRESYNLLSSGDIFRQVLNYWKNNYSFDAIFLAGTALRAAKFIKTTRKAGIDCPIISGYDLDTPKLRQIAEKMAIDVYVPTVFYPEDPQESVQLFIKKFKKRYHTVPDMAAEQGYDALMALTQAIRKTRNTVPDNIARTLKSKKGWEGVTGRYSFDKTGNIIGKKILIKRITGGFFKEIKSD